MTPVQLRIINFAVFCQPGFVCNGHIILAIRLSLSTPTMYVLVLMH